MQIAIRPHTSIEDLTYSNLFSDEGRILVNEYRSYWYEYIEPITNGGNYQELMDELLEVIQETRAEGWDGYNGESVRAASIEQAAVFLKQWPAEFPNPEISVDPDGEISFDWIKNKYLTFSISFSGHGHISYAGLIGANSIRGKEIFDEEIPEVVFQQIKRVFSF